MTQDDVPGGCVLNNGGECFAKVPAACVCAQMPAPSKRTVWYVVAENLKTPSTTILRVETEGGIEGGGAASGCVNITR